METIDQVADKESLWLTSFKNYKFLESLLNLIEQAFFMRKISSYKNVYFQLHSTLMLLIFLSQIQNDYY